MGFEPGKSGNPAGRPKQKPFLDWCKKWTVESAETYLKPLAEQPGKQQLDAIKTIMAYGVGKPVETLDASHDFGGVASDPNTIASGLADLISRGQAHGLGVGAGDGADKGPVPPPLLDSERGAGEGNQ